MLRSGVPQSPEQGIKRSLCSFQITQSHIFCYGNRGSLNVNGLFFQFRFGPVFPRYAPFSLRFGMVMCILRHYVLEVCVLHYDIITSVLGPGSGMW